MSRSIRTIRTLVALVLVSFALAATSACADATGPAHPACDWSSGNVCKSLGATDGSGGSALEDSVAWLRRRVLSRLRCRSRATRF